MPRKTKSKLPPLALGEESLGQRLARLRKERGFTQLELSKKIGIIRELISDYERGRLRPNYEMVIRFALALEVSADELLGLKPLRSVAVKPNLKILRRMKRIEALPPSKQKIILKNIDIVIDGVEAQK